ncbi:hypothetical protein [Congregibacter litoralis]|uniref:DUF883 domain-containing protein n=1 Tax=Congregibacter litoralis KT71 TaxID=314285 RepID=A4A4V7_9GAMM|nr:hypothetical protein [Congregibacter litoralis]EAQ98828.1 hypothetical protein KT71_09382 [Congregibacter litoralis KT71]
MSDLKAGVSKHIDQNVTKAGANPEQASTTAPFTASVNRSDASEGSTTAKVAAAAHTAIDAFEERASSTEQLLREQASQLGEKGEEATHQVQDVAGQFKNSAMQYVEERPVQSLAIAFGVGALAATLLRK